jgi:signal transduction histidine kinase
VGFQVTLNRAPPSRAAIADDEPGIPTAILPRIFDPFFTTKPVGEGTGLGLAMVYGILEEHGGWVEVRSEQGRGSCFTAFIPTGVTRGA